MMPVRSDESLISIPNDYECPITHELMEDPVTAADGFSYERTSIEQWFKKGHRTSPKTGAQLLHTNLTPNQTLRSIIIEFKEKLPYRQREQQTRTDLDAAVCLREEDIEQLSQKSQKVQLEVSMKTATVEQAKKEPREDAKHRKQIGSCKIVVRNQLNIGLAKYGIDTIEGLPVAIEDKKRDITRLEKSKRTSEAAARRSSLAELEELQVLVEQMKSLDIVEPADNKRQIMERALKTGLEKHGIESIEGLPVGPVLENVHFAAI